VKNRNKLVVAIALLGVACSSDRKNGSSGGTDASQVSGAIDGSVDGSSREDGPSVDGEPEGSTDLGRESGGRLDGQISAEAGDDVTLSPDSAVTTPDQPDADIDATPPSQTYVAQKVDAADDDCSDSGGQGFDTASLCTSGCLIASLCYPTGVSNPSNPCLICDTGRSTSSWSNNDGATCDDGKFCTVGDTCSAGVCSGSARNCSDGIACNGTETCDEASDACLAGTSTCGGGSVCSASSGACVAVSTCPGCVINGVCYGDGQTNPGNQCQKCTSATNASAWTISGGATCDDGKFCTVGDTCSSAGACTGTTRSCDDGVACNGTETCDLAKDKCVAAASTCPTNTVCNVATDQCVATCTGCVISNICYGDGQTNPNDPCKECLQGTNATAWSNKQDGASCDDGNFCNGVDTCSKGSCGHSGSPCNSGTSCIEAKKACYMVGVAMCNADGDVVQYDASGNVSLLHDCVAPSAHGTCVAGVCGCAEGYSGADCQSQDLPPGCVVRVSTSGNDANDGSTWAFAVATVQTGLNLAASKINESVTACEVWVAAGTYKPTTGTDRSATFLLKANVGLYGGFAGTEVRRSQRDITAFRTTLSGDVGVTGLISDNSYHVVTGVTGGTIDGFTITAGYASGDNTNGNGGGMYNVNSSPTVTNCMFSGNSASFRNANGAYNASYGGGMYNENSSPTVTNCTFSGNSASSFSENGLVTSKCLSYGGGMYNKRSSPTVTNCTFSGNSASSFSTSVSYNASYGGGMYNDNSSPTVTNCTFFGNSASSFLGLIDGHAYGGGMYNDNSWPTVVNSIFWGDFTSIQDISTASEFDSSGGSSANVSYSIVQGGHDGTGNIDEDPQLSTSDLRLLSGSPAIDHGTGCVSSVPATDKEGKQRWDIASVTNATGTSGVDIGAYEYQGQVSSGDTLVTPLCQVPTVTTSVATSLATLSAVLNGSGVPNGLVTTGWFRISTTNPGSCNDTFGTRVPATDGTLLGSGTAAVPYSLTATGLTPGTL
jgi:hypothetical protein